jgi:hypothetical protein
MAHRYTRGLVLYMYAEELLRFGASHTAKPEDAVSAEHYFLCISADATGGLWTPLYQTRGQDRQYIPESAKSGHSRFVGTHAFYSTSELWTIPHKAAQRAAAVAGDKSGPKAENRVAESAVPAPQAFSAAAG